MLQTLKQKVKNVGLSNDEVTTYGLSVLGIVVVKQGPMHDMMKQRGYPLHTFRGHKFFFCVGTFVY